MIRLVSFLIALSFTSLTFAGDGFWTITQSWPYDAGGTPEQNCATLAIGQPWKFETNSANPSLYNCFAWEITDDPCEDETENTEWNQETVACEPPPPPPPQCDFPAAQAADYPPTTTNQTVPIPNGGISIENTHDVINLCVSNCRAVKEITVTAYPAGSHDYAISDTVSQTAFNESCDSLPPDTHDAQTVLINPPGYGTGGKSGGTSGSGSGGGVGSGSGDSGSGGTGPGGTDTTGTGAPQTGGSGSVGTGVGSTSGGGARGDRDGDGLANNRDGDIDGDGIANSLDDDIDGDGVPNADDTDPDGEEEGFGEAVVSSSCVVQPKCDSEDPVQCAILHQSWLNQCGFEKFELPEALSASAIETEIQGLEDELTLKLNEISAEVSNLINFSASGGSSIVPNYVNIFGVQVDFSFSRWVAEFSIIGAVILAMAWFLAIGIILNRG